MTRKRFKKLIMAAGYDRISAECYAVLARFLVGNYAEAMEDFMSLGHLRRRDTAPRS